MGLIGLQAHQVSGVPGITEGNVVKKVPAKLFYFILYFVSRVQRLCKPLCRFIESVVGQSETVLLFPLLTGSITFAGPTH